MLVLDEGCLDRWLSDFDEFRVDFLKHCYVLAKVVGYYPQVDFKVLKVAYVNWLAQHALWKTKFVPADTVALSHIKVLSILLYQLACVPWVKELTEFDPAEDGLEDAFAGTPDEREEVRKDVNAGRGTYLAMQFAFHVLNWFEEGRVDRQKPFVFRLTPDLEHDLIVYLLSEAREELAVYLILKALYTRDPA